MNSKPDSCILLGGRRGPSRSLPLHSSPVFVRGLQRPHASKLRGTCVWGDPIKCCVSESLALDSLEINQSIHHALWSG